VIRISYFHLLYDFNIVDLRKAVDYLKRELKKVGKAIAAFKAVISDRSTKLIERNRRSETKDSEGAAKDQWPR
jgi:hypothetical protein